MTTESTTTAPDQQTLPIETEPKPATEQPTTPEPADAQAAPPVLDPEIAAKLVKLAELEAEEEKRKEARMSEAEKVSAERTKLRTERFRFELERAGIPAEMAALIPAPSEGDINQQVAKIAGAWQRSVPQPEKTTTSHGPRAGGGEPSIAPQVPSTNPKGDPADQPFIDLAKALRKRASGG